jgi:hypothetical protein
MPMPMLEPVNTSEVARFFGVATIPLGAVILSRSEGSPGISAVPTLTSTFPI